MTFRAAGAEAELCGRCFSWRDQHFGGYCPSDLTRHILGVEVGCQVLGEDWDFLSEGGSFGWTVERIVAGILSGGGLLTWAALLREGDELSGVVCCCRQCSVHFISERGSEWCSAACKGQFARAGLRRRYNEHIEAQVDRLEAL